MNNWIKDNLARHPDIVEDLLSLSKKEKAIEICAALSNSKLVKYYEQYGLKTDLNFNRMPKKLDLSYVPMSGYVYNILEKCSSIETSLSISSRKKQPRKTKSARRKPRKTKSARRKPKSARRKPRKTKSTRHKSNKYKR